MRIGIMQPYFIPYLGYWQLMNVVDQYVIYDDVNFIKGGRINRNKILINNVGQNVNLLLHKASPNKLINEITLIDDEKKSRKKMMRTFEMAYHKAPYWDEIKILLDGILDYSDLNLAYFLKNSFEIIGNYLNIQANLLLSSDIPKDMSLKGKYKVYEICKILGATEYYNSIGGFDLYSKEEFKQQNIELKFLKMKDISYKQFENEFVPYLSIIDVLMFNSKQEVQDFLLEYDII